MGDLPDRVPSGVLRIAIAGEPVTEHCAGLIGDPDGMPCTTGTRFQIASVSKQFTAAAVLVLAERGHLSVSDAAARWFPGGPDGWESVTVHQLLTHTSGLGHWEDFPGIDIFAATSDERMLEVIRGRPLLSAPGGRFSYSSLGYWLLARIVEEVAEQPYAEFLSQAVLAPAGLADTFAGSAGQRSNVASGHSGGVPASSYELNHTGKGAGDIYSTASDLDRWSRSLRAVLPADRSRQLMFTAHAAAGQSLGTWGTEDAYGYGWYLHGPAPATLRYHSGHNSGFNSFSAWRPDKELSPMILTNDDSIDPQAIAREELPVARAHAAPGRRRR